MKKLPTLLTLMLLSVPTVALGAGAQSDDVTWEYPTQRVDGSPITPGEIVATELQGTREGILLVDESLPNPQTGYTFPRELPPNYIVCWKARVLATDGQRSEWSPETCKEVRGKPNPAQNVTVK